MAVGEFKAKRLAVMDEVQAKQTAVTVIKHGKPVARLVPTEEKETNIFGFSRASSGFQGQTKIHGDIDVPGVPA